MYLVTNRRVQGDEKGLDVLGSTPSEKGPNELRLVKVTRRGKGFETELLDDELSKTEVRGLKAELKLGIDPNVKWFASLRVACELMVRAREEKKHVLVYVHGYNNDVEDIVKNAEALEKQFDVLVLPFTWPANGGGPVSGTAAYLSDKRDARASMDALNRFIGKVSEYHALLTAGRREVLWTEASAGRVANQTEARERFTQLLDRDCKVTVNLICHSMGNYLLKYALGPTDAAARELVFDNISLVAADANNPDHEEWVERIQVRNRLHIVINEDDFALGFSRRKPGQEQRARLGHHLKNLKARNAYYVNVTDASWVKNSHSYFHGQPVSRNAELRKFFARAFEGGRADELLRYHADRNLYELK